MKKNNPVPELLAPAGNALCAIAAFDAGADAIYCGLGKFNARERSENFTPETMGKIIAYAHSIKRKVYVTFNTILKENELPEVAEHLALLASLEPDALIVQDLGAARMIREYFPELTIHASTQMGFHNSAGVAFARSFGAERVILERQMTMEELQIVREKNPDIELEVFIHGALCCSLSGQCLFSSYLGGYSGNRGFCKQPCRRRYYSNHGNGFFFSPQDLETLELVGKLREIGVESLKIEGRLRQPDYVYNTVKAYRMVLNAPESKPSPEILGEARVLLSKSCGRKWSKGFFSEDSMKNLIIHDNIGSAGMLIGSVSQIAENGFSAVIRKKIHLGDRIRIQPQSGDDGPALTLTKMFVNGESVRKAMPNDEVFICFDREVPPRGVLYKIGESFPDYSARFEKLPLQKKRVDLAIELDASHFSCRVTNSAVNCSYEEAVELSKAQKQPLTAEKLTAEFAAADSADFALGKCTVKLEEGLFVPGSVLKELRRAVWAEIKGSLSIESLFKPGAEGLGKFALDYHRIQPYAFADENIPETVAVKPNGVLPGKPKARTATSVFDVNKTTYQAILPEFTPEGRLDGLKKAIKTAYQNGIRSFRVQSLFELPLLQDFKDIEIIVSDPVPIANSMAVMELQKLGVSGFLAHAELDKTALENLRDHAVLPMEVYRLGRLPLLVTRAAIPVEGNIKDARTNEFSVRYDKRSQLTRIYPVKVISIPRIAGTADFYDITNANWKNPEETTFNYDLALN
ncbi:MAG: U32 family peptidase [Lentisphaeria bacterium]|nr:U32 family peptidase [Lentisphaeria bacterium]